MKRVHTAPPNISLKIQKYKEMNFNMILCDIQNPVIWYTETYRFFSDVFRNMILYTLNPIYHFGIPLTFNGMVCKVSSLSVYDNSINFIQQSKYRKFWKRSLFQLRFPDNQNPSNTTLSSMVVQTVARDISPCLIKMVALPRDIQKLILAYY